MLLRFDGRGGAGLGDGEHRRGDVGESADQLGTHVMREKSAMAVAVYIAEEVAVAARDVEVRLDAGPCRPGRWESVLSGSVSGGCGSRC